MEEKNREFRVELFEWTDPLVRACRDFVAFKDAIDMNNRAVAAAWRDAGQEEMEHLLQEHLLQLVPDAQAYIYPIIARRTSKIANDIPVLKAVFGLERETRGLKDLANDFITRADGRIDQDPSPFRPACAASLPSWSVADDYWRALDAPVAAAMAACERIKLSHAQIACVKSVSRKHPRWFYEGFVAAFFSHQAKGN